MRDKSPFAFSTGDISHICTSYALRNGLFVPFRTVSYTDVHRGLGHGLGQSVTATIWSNFSTAKVQEKAPKSSDFGAFYGGQYRTRTCDPMHVKHKNGEEFYWLLYYTYLSPQELQNVEEIIDQLRPHIRDISTRTYYRKRKETVEVLSSVLWGYTAQDSAGIVREILQ